MPLLDGVISPGEWENAAVLNGFSNSGSKGQLLGSKQGKVFIKKTKDYLYLAVKTITLNDSPGGGLRNAATQNDDIKLLNDDTVELTFFNPQKPDEISHLIFNPGGFCLDICRNVRYNTVK